MTSKFIIFLFVFSVHVYGQKSNPVSFSNISIDTMGLVKWSTTYTQDSHSLQIIIERLVNNKWVEAGGFGCTWLENPKTMNVSRVDSSQVKFHKGTNKYRIRMTYPSKATSIEFQLLSKVSNDDGSLWISGGQIILDKKEYWEIIGNNAVVLKKGETQIVDISFLIKGSYWLYTPTSTRPFIKD